MTDLLVPGAHRAHGVLDEAAVLTALLRVEEAWSQVLTAAGAAPAGAALDDGALAALVTPADADALAQAAEGSGNVVVPLVTLLRDRLRAGGRDAAAHWLHRGLTSQDVLDTALVLALLDAAGRIRHDLLRQVTSLRDLAAAHRDSVMAGRTLTQHAVPTTFGLVAAGWLHGLLDAAEGLGAATAALPTQVGGAAGTLAGPAELLGSPSAAHGAASDLAARLGLPAAPPWHVRRHPFTRLADALVTCTDAMGAVVGEVLVLSRPEVGEVREGTGGGSSTMPHKANPVLSVLVRRAALLAPPAAAALHTAAALAEDQRSSGPWHAEWPLLRELARTTVTAASQAADLLENLVVDAERMRATATAAAGDLLAEQRSLGALGSLPGPVVHHHGSKVDLSSMITDGVEGYLGAAGLLVDDAVARADVWLASADTDTDTASDADTATDTDADEKGRA